MVRSPLSSASPISYDNPTNSKISDFKEFQVHSHRNSSEKVTPSQDDVVIGSSSSLGKEAGDMRAMIQKMGPYDESLYEKLMQSREKGVLDVIHRVLDDDAQQRELSKSQKNLVSQPLHVLILESFRVVRGIMLDFRDVRSLADVIQVLTFEKRPKFIGVFIVFIAIMGLIISCM